MQYVMSTGNRLCPHHFLFCCWGFDSYCFTCQGRWGGIYVHSHNSSGSGVSCLRIIIWVTKRNTSTPYSDTYSNTTIWSSFEQELQDLQQLLKIENMWACKFSWVCDSNGVSSLRREKLIQPLLLVLSRNDTYSKFQVSLYTVRYMYVQCSTV